MQVIIDNDRVRNKRILIPFFAKVVNNAFLGNFRFEEIKREDVFHPLFTFAAYPVYLTINLAVFVLSP